MADTDELFRQLYAELKKIASVRMGRERPGHTLQTTELINEAYLRLSRVDGSAWQDRTHFLATAARAMRHILVDHARSKKRRLVLVGLDAEMAAEMPEGVDYLVLDRAIDALSEEHRRPADTLQYRYILGLTAEDTASLLKVSERTVRNDTRLALAWLRRHLSTN